MIGVLPPAGDAVTLVCDRAATERLNQRWLPYRPYFYGSGTSALAAAITAALKCRPGRVEVILPGYGCPALVAAVLQSGGQPVLVDLEPSSPHVSLRELEQLISPSTAAVVAVNFLGIPERLEALAAIAHRNGALLIEDSAQAFPPSGLEQSAADFAILSFGRGKPVSLLGGGAVLCSSGELAEALPKPAMARAKVWQVRAKATAYNWLRRPQLYWIPQVLPLGLGETRYEPLTAIEGFDEVRYQALAAAIDMYERNGQENQRLMRRHLLDLRHGLTDLAEGVAESRPLLRYPVLAPSAAMRSQLLRRLSRAGLGGTALYGSAMPEVADIPAARVKHGALPNSRDLAQRLLTLPVHQGVRPTHVARIRGIIEAALSESGAADYKTEKTG